MGHSWAIQIGPGVTTPHPSALRKGGEGTCRQLGEIVPIASSGPRLGGSMHATPPGHAPNVDECRYVHTAPPRSAETPPKPAETNTSHTNKTVDVKSAPHAKHTASRISWLNTRGPGVRIRKRASQFSLKLTKDENGLIKPRTCRVVPDSSVFTATNPVRTTYSYNKLSVSNPNVIRELIKHVNRA
jgi:hypothetical protein